MRRRIMVVCLVGTISIFNVFLGTGVPMASEKKVIRIYSHEGTAPNMAGFKTLVERYQKDHPEFKIEATYTSYTEMLPKLLVAIVTGDYPHMAEASSTHIGDLWSTGVMQPLDAIIEEHGEKDFLAAALEQVKYEGHYYQVPTWSESNAVLYRTDWWDQMGLAVPKTWDEWLDATKKLNKQDLDQDGDIEYGTALPGAKSHGTQVIWDMLLWNNGAKIWDAQNNLTINSPQAVEALEFYKRLFEYALPGSINFGFAETYEIPGTSQAASVTTNIHALGRMIQKNPDIAPYYGLFAIPPRTSGITSPAQSVITGWQVLRWGGMKEEITDFILYLERPENLSYYANQRPVGQLPATYSAIEAHWDNPVVANRRDLVERHLEIAEKGHNAFFFDGPRPGRGRVFATLVISEGVQKVFLGEMTPREAVDWMEKEIRDLM